MTIFYTHYFLNLRLFLFKSDIFVHPINFISLTNSALYKRPTSLATSLVPKNIIPLGTVNIDVNVLNTTFANKPTGTNARKYKKYFTENNIGSEQDRKNEFKRLTGKDWMPKYGSIL